MHSCKKCHHLPSKISLKDSENQNREVFAHERQNWKPKMNEPCHPSSGTKYQHDCIKDITTWAQEHFRTVVRKQNSLLCLQIQVITHKNHQQQKPCRLLRVYAHLMMDRHDRQKNVPRSDEPTFQTDVLPSRQKWHFTQRPKFFGIRVVVFTKMVKIP